MMHSWKRADSAEEERKKRVMVFGKQTVGFLCGKNVEVDREKKEEEVRCLNSWWEELETGGRRWEV
jgi:hypothetical protein